MSEIKFRNLKASELEVRVGEKKNGKMTLLVYKDSRVDQDILDETVGNENWSVTYDRVGDTLICRLGIYCEKHKAFIYKSAAGAPSNFEAVKGEQSDAFKRAGFVWGIGRGLYSAPKIRIPESNATHSVSLIDYYENGKIKDLQIVDWNDNVVFNYEDGKVVPYREPEIDRAELLRIVCSELKRDEENDRGELLRFYNYYMKKYDSFDRWNEATVRKLWRKWASKS